MIVIVFRARVREGADLEGLSALGQRMYELAAAMPGFISYKDFSASDGENVTVVEFASEAELLSWRNHPEHVAAQERGRTEFLNDYRIQVCRVERAYGFSQAEGRVEIG